MSHPYKQLPTTAFWRKSISKVEPENVDPVVSFNLKLSPDTKVSTAGSCFAQHIARHLQKAGFNYYITEAGHPVIPEKIRKEHNYGTFSARYGNIYTARQLLQLFKRAYNSFQPIDTIWTHEDGSYRDPFRPNVQPGGFISEEELLLDRKQHLSAVRTMFETMDVFVFTLGLTECWRNKADGTVFPLCPGVEGGEFNNEKYEFYNQTAADVTNDMEEFVSLLTDINPTIQIILTVSPVPLMATAREDEHVLSATTYSKSVLRVAAETLKEQHDSIHYFPSYEIITGNFNRGGYYSDDLRSVVESGVNHVMRLFLKHAANTVIVNDKEQKQQSKESVTEDKFAQLAQQLVDVECDEELLDR